MVEANQGVVICLWKTEIVLQTSFLLSCNIDITSVLIFSAFYDRACLKFKGHARAFSILVLLCLLAIVRNV